MGNRGSLSKSQIKELRRKVSFTPDQIQEWYMEYKTSCKNSRTKYLTVSEFKRVYNKIYGGDANNFAEHIFRVFDTNGDGRVSFQEFLIGLSVSASDNTEKRLRWAFQMYDIDNNGYISHEELLELITAIYRMTPTIEKPTSVKTPDKMAETIFRALDKNNDQQISYEEFREGVEKDPTVVYLLQLNPDLT